jgi:hypothetical protein
VNATNASAASCIKDVNAQSEKSVDTSQYNELSLPKFSDSSKQVVFHFIRELDEYFTLKKTPEETVKTMALLQHYQHSSCMKIAENSRKHTSKCISLEI